MAPAVRDRGRSEASQEQQARAKVARARAGVRHRSLRGHGRFSLIGGRLESGEEGGIEGSALVERDRARDVRQAEALAMRMAEAARRGKTRSGAERERLMTIVPGGAVDYGMGMIEGRSVDRY